MTAAASFKQADLTRAVKGLKAAGYIVGRIRIQPGTGEIVIDPAGSAGARKGSSWDDVLP